MDATPQLSSPVCYTLLLLIVAASLIGFSRPQWLVRNLFRPYWLIREREFHTLVSSGFLHGSLGHLVFNCFTFWAFGPRLEVEMGTPAFACLYLLGLLGSDLGTYVHHRQDPQYRSLGASGAILAVLFASIAYFPHSSIFILPIPLPIPAPLFALGYLVYSFVASRQAQAGRINHDAHLAGAIIGLGFVALYAPARMADLLHSVLG